MEINNSFAYSKIYLFELRIELSSWRANYFSKWLGISIDAKSQKDQEKKEEGEFSGHFN